jgi:dipeptidyl aminopeptidase/acylaminoacyl peptidase
MAMTPVPLIPRRVFFDEPERSDVRLSPDGARIAFLAPLDGVANVWVGDIAAIVRDPAAARPVTRDRGRGVRTYHWAYDGVHLLYLQDDGGDEDWRLHRVDLETGEDVDLTPLPGVQARIVHLSPRHPGSVLVGLNDRDPAWHDPHLLDLRTGERRLVCENPGFSRLVCDDELRVRLGERVTDDGGTEWSTPEGDDWRPFLRVGLEDGLTTEVRGFDADGATLYLADSRGRDTAALVAVDLATGSATVLAEDPRADVGDVLWHPLTRRPQAADLGAERSAWRVLDPDVAADLKLLEDETRGDLAVVSRTLDDALWVATDTVDDGPTRFLLVDRAANAPRPLFVDRPALEGLPLAAMRPVTVAARDGLPLVGYLTRPVAGAGAGGDGPDPLVLLVHGGPYGRDHWGYHPLHQWLANRGYAVLSVNFRGSTGFGKAFVNAGDREWGAKMQDDLHDAVAWAVGQGVADPERVAIMGGSYGGYATLAGLTFTPEAFACGVDIVGPSNLVTMVETIPPYWRSLIEVDAKRVGDARTEEGRAFLWSRSPLAVADRIRRPLLIGHGANDPRVARAESDEIVAVMGANGIPVTYVVFPDEGHGFVRPPNRLAFRAVTEAFLGAVLGGRVEPVGDDLEGSSITVPVGAELIEGLPEALARQG